MVVISRAACSFLTAMVSVVVTFALLSPYMTGTDFLGSLQGSIFIINNRHGGGGGGDTYKPWRAESNAPWKSPVPSVPSSPSGRCFINDAAHSPQFPEDAATACGYKLIDYTSAMCKDLPICFSNVAHKKSKTTVDITFVSDSKVPAIYANGIAIDPSYIEANCNVTDITSNILHARLLHLQRVSEINTIAVMSRSELEGGGRSVKWVQEPSLLVPPHRWGPNIYHISSMWNGAMQWMNNLPAYGSPDAIENIFTIGHDEIEGNWTNAFIEASRPSDTPVQNLYTYMLQFVNMKDPNHFICFENPVIVDMGSKLLQFVNKTILEERSTPIFSRDAQIMKERVYAKYNLKPQTLLPPPSKKDNGRVPQVEAELLMREEILLDQFQPVQLTPPSSKNMVYLLRQPPKNANVQVRDDTNQTIIPHDRVFDDAAAEAVKSLLVMKAKQLNFKLIIVDFEDVPFEEQLTLMRNADMLVTIHGAGITNSMFMPSGSTLIEIAPWDFTRAAHFVQGGHANIWYAQHGAQEPSGKGPYPHLDLYNNDLRYCIEIKLDCRNWYRDQIIKLNEYDLQEIGKLVEEASRFLQIAEASSSIIVEPEIQARNLR